MVTNFRLTSGENSGVNQLFQYDMVLLTKIKMLDQPKPFKIYTKTNFTYGYPTI